jgi:CTP:molybdopterin cytidylyltransferase MocA
MEDFKPLLNYDGKTFVSSILEKLYPVCKKIGIVTGFKSNEVKYEINNFINKTNINNSKIQIIDNPGFETGMFSSLQTGLKELSMCDWLIYHFVDQPHLPANFYPEFIDQIENGYDWIQPQYNHKKGHPILLNKSLFVKILDLKIESLKEIGQSQSTKKKIWNCTYPQVVEDIDTQEDYQKLT